MRVARSQILLVAFFGTGVAIITATAAADPQLSGDLRRLAQSGSWPLAVTLAALSVLVPVAMAWVARLTFMLTRASLAVGRLPRSDRLPARLLSAIERTGAGPVRCITEDVAIAFCAGARRPEIVASVGLVERLNGNELDAVLLHEYDHVRRREPLVRAAAESAAEVLFFLPLARWWSRHRTEAAELRADQAAVRRMGPRPVASALRTLGSAGRAEASFVGVAELRVAQLLGDRLPRRRPASAVVAASLLGIPFALVVGGCLVLDAARILGH
jgi:Zn-dependent protease with chaperone function